MITRALEKAIRERIFKGKAIIVFGARQVGKTSMLRKITQKLNERTLWLNCDEADVRELLSNTTSGRLKAFFGNNRIVVIDEAQRVQNIGITLKLVADEIKDVQLIATGSSAFELADSIKEPLTGRKYEYFLYPLTFGEMVEHTDLLSEKRMLDHRLIFGYYPEIVSNIGREEELLRLLAGSYLYKDLLMLEGIKKPILLEKILRALALQLGSEISYNEIGQLVQAKSETVEKYVALLEKTYIIFQMNALSKNLRNEIKKGKKVYFWDNGIRNAILGNYNLLQSRTDVAALWENFIISERLKMLQNSGQNFSSWFWRTTQQQEIDYIEERSGKLFAYEIKWNSPKARFPLTFTKAYPECKTDFINKNNYEEFVMNI